MTVPDKTELSFRDRERERERERDQRERERERERSESELQRWFTIELLKFVSTNIADICAVTTQ